MHGTPAVLMWKCKHEVAPSRLTQMRVVPTSRMASGLSLLVPRVERRGAS